MYVLQAIGILFIMVGIVDIIYSLYKKYIEYVSNKSGYKREINLSLVYPGAFLIGGLVRIIIFEKDVSFLILLKDSVLWGLLLMLIVYNIVIIKRRFTRAKGDFQRFKDIERSDGEKLFSKKNKDNKNKK